MGRLTRLFFHSPYMADPKNAEDKDLEQGLSDEDVGDEGKPVDPKKADAAPEGDEDPENLKKRLRDTQDALRKEREARKKAEKAEKEKEEAAPKGKGPNLEEVAEKVYENKETDTRFFDQNPEMARFRSALQDLRVKTDRSSSLAEIAVRYGFAEQAKLEAAKGKALRSETKSNPDEIPAYGTPAYEEWRKNNLVGGSSFRRLR